ncbi:MAG: LysR family transcriptional regulator [Actinomycetota bacterium]|nr:LysR family transcriptional regulator [Actinomycetota bacterium]
MLDLRRLAVFREVAERGSFSHAAEELGYTQSVVSHHVAQLERGLGVSLFERGRRPVRLTPAGERLRIHAGSVLGAAAAAEDEMRALAGLETGLVRIGAFLSACATFVPEAIGAFEALHPGVEVRLIQEEPPAALARLVAGELDLAVIFEEHDDSPAADPRHERVALAEDAYRFVCHPAHRLARRREVGFADLRDERFIAPRAAGGGLRYRALVERWCAEEGFEPNFAYTVDDVTVARTFAAAGLAVGIMPNMTVGHPRPDVAVKPIRGVGAFRTIEVRWLRGRRMAGVAPMVAQLRKAAGARLR